MDDKLKKETQELTQMSSIMERFMTTCPAPLIGPGNAFLSAIMNYRARLQREEMRRTTGCPYGTCPCGRVCQPDLPLEELTRLEYTRPEETQDRQEYNTKKEKVYIVEKHLSLGSIRPHDQLISAVLQDINKRFHDGRTYFWKSFLYDMLRFLYEKDPKTFDALPVDEVSRRIKFEYPYKRGGQYFFPKNVKVREPNCIGRVMVPKTISVLKVQDILLHLLPRFDIDPDNLRLMVRRPVQKPGREYNDWANFKGLFD